MNAHLAHILDKALGLPAAERAALTVALLDSLEGSDDSSIAEAWRQEILSLIHISLMAEKRCSVIVLQSGHRQAIERDGRPFGPVNLEW